VYPSDDQIIELSSGLIDTQFQPLANELRARRKVINVGDGIQFNTNSSRETHAPLAAIGNPSGPLDEKR
jgi:hypothetical protein